MKKKVLTCLSVVLVILALISLVACDTTYNVTIQESEHGSVTADVETIKEGENLTLTIAPDEGYVLDSLSINDAEVAVEGLSYVVENVTSDITVSATFIRLYSVSIAASSNGSVTASASQVVAGGSLTLTINPEDHYQLDKLYINDSPVEVSGNTYVVNNASSDIAVKATFIRCNVVSFNYGLGQGEEASRNIIGSIAIGELPSASIEGGIFLGWYLDGEKIDEAYIVSGDITLNASYLSAEVTLSGKEVLSGLTEGNVNPTVSVRALIDGEENSDIALSVSIDNEEIASINDDNQIEAIGEGEVALIVKYGEIEIARIEGISCMDYSEYTAISNKDEFLAINSNLAGKYYLTQNIDLGGKQIDDWGVFTGIIDGRGYAVSNFVNQRKWDQGLFYSVSGTIKNIGFINYNSPGDTSVNTALFGKLVTGTIENVYIDCNIRCTAPFNATCGVAVVTEDLKGGTLRNIVINIRTDKESFIDNVAGIALICSNGENKEISKVENLVIMSNGKALTYELMGGLYGRDLSADAQHKNVGAFLDTYSLLNSELDNAWLNDGVWSIRDGAIYFHDTLALEATPEWDVRYNGSKNINKEYGLQIPDAEGLGFSILNNGQATDEFSEDLFTLSSSNEAVAKILYDEDDGFYVEYVGAGSAVLSITVGDTTININVTLTQYPEWNVSYSGAESIAKEYGATLPEAEEMAFSILNYGSVTEEFEASVYALSSNNEEVAKLVYDNGFKVQYLGAGSAVLSITVGDTTININVTLTQAPEWAIDDISDINEVYAEGLAAINVAVSGKNYLDDLTALPSIAEVSSSDTDVATVAIEGLNIVVTPVGIGEATITLKIDGVEKSFKATMVDPDSLVDLIYDGGDINVQFETEKVLDIEIKGQKDGQDVSVPVAVKLNSSNSSVAELFLDNGVIKVRVKGEGETTLSAQCGDNDVVSFKVNATKVYYIASIGDFRTKISANLAGKYVLTADLDFENTTPTGTWLSFGVFTGSIDGQGHSISNMVLGDGWNGGIFTTINEGAVIKNIAFVNIQSTANAHGLFGSMNNATVENCYVDYLFNGNGHYLDGNWSGTGAICMCQEENAIVRNTIINIRFKDGFNFESINYIGAISGKAMAWSTMCYDTKVIVNADVTLKLAYADGADNYGVQAQWTTCATYSDFESLKASGVEAYDSTLWTINESGIKFGENLVLAATVSEAE